MAQHIWKIPSRPPHDFFLCLDVDSYFDHEHQPEELFEQGFTRPVPLSDRDVLVTIFFNGDVDSPSFTIRAHESLTDAEQAEADSILRRILGTDLDVTPLYDQAGNDPVLAGPLRELYGLKRISRANIFEDAVNRIIRTQIKHKPTARKMVHEVRNAYGTRLESGNRVIPAWPRPQRLVSADPRTMKQYGLSLRKGEYLTELAHELLHGRLAGGGGPEPDTHAAEGVANDSKQSAADSLKETYNRLELMPPEALYESLVSIRGIGPTTAQDLILFRNRSDGWFASHKQKGQEKAVRRWIILAYGGDPDHCSEEAFRRMIKPWQGFEAAALEFLYVNWVLSEKKQAQHL